MVFKFKFIAPIDPNMVFKFEVIRLLHRLASFLGSPPAFSTRNIKSEISLEYFQSENLAYI